MKKNGKNGFTLVELLAVIVILAVVLVISVPRIQEVIDSTRLKALESSAKLILKGADKVYTAKSMDDSWNITSDPITCDYVVELNEKDYKSCTLSLVDNRMSIVLYGSSTFNEYKCVNTINDLNCYKLTNININFDGNGGDISYTSKKYKMDSKYIELPTANKTGYTFLGWYTNATEGELITPNSNVDFISDSTLYAHYEINNYNINYDLDGGIIDAKESYTYFDDTYTLPMPLKSGYIFLGWTGSNGDTASLNVTIPINSMEDKSYKANWRKNEENFAYTGNYQTFIAYESGTYKIELWGASGGPEVESRGNIGGYGAYTSGNIYLNKGDTLYFYVGAGYKEKSTFGGAGSGDLTGSWNDSHDGKYAAGGATDVRLVSGAYNNSTSLNSRIMVAAGGGGGNNGDANGMGGSGGGLIGITALDATISNAGGVGGNQTAGYSFGIGQNSGVYPNDGGADTGAGGGGYYGGYRGSSTNCGGGGGSSYISGHTGCVAITSASNSAPRSGCTTGTTNNSCSIHYSSKTFTNTVMIDGLGYSWTNTRGSQVQMPNYNGGYYVLGKGNVGNGYAKIYFIN